MEKSSKEPIYWFIIIWRGVCVCAGDSVCHGLCVSADRGYLGIAGLIPDQRQRTDLDAKMPMPG